MGKTFKCESCGGNLLFNAETQELMCEYCGNESEIIDKKANGVVMPYTSDLEYVGYKDARHIFQCNSCTTHIATFDDKTLTRCPSCGNKDLKEVQESGVHPIAVVPFKISKDEAVTIFDKWIKSRKFAPNDLKKLAKLKKLSGLYAPIFLFNFTATTEYSASCSNNYEDRKGNKRRGPTRYINDIETKEFYNYIYTANKGLSSKIFRKLDCCNISNVKSYQSEYMLGFTGVGSDYSVHDAYNGTKDEVSSSEASRLKSRLNSRYDNVSFFKSTTILSDVTNSYVYFPIWANHYHYKKKDFHCYINGDNGKVYGKSPKSFWKLLGLVSAIVGVGLLLFLLLKH